MAFSVTNDFTASTVAESAKVNQNFTDIETEFNAFPTNGALKDGAVSATAKLADNILTWGKLNSALVKDEDNMASDSATVLCTQQSIKAYVDNSISAIDDILGSWTNKDSNSDTLVKDEVYKAGSAGLVCAIGTCGVSAHIEGYTDSSNPPTTMRQQNSAANTLLCSITLPVVKDEYFKITTNNISGLSIYWLPIGSGTCVKQ